MSLALGNGGTVKPHFHGSNLPQELGTFEFPPQGPGSKLSLGDIILTPKKSNLGGACSPEHF